MGKKYFFTTYLCVYMCVPPTETFFYYRERGEDTIARRLKESGL